MMIRWQPHPSVTLCICIQSESTETGAPALIMIDETAPMLKHEMFRDNFIKGLQEGRKKRQAYLCAFQQPNIVDELGVGDAVRGQCKTMIFFRNTQATPESYAKWNLTDSEYDFISGRFVPRLSVCYSVKTPGMPEKTVRVSQSFLMST